MGPALGGSGANLPPVKKKMGSAAYRDRSEPMVREYKMAERCGELEVYVRRNTPDRCFIPIVGFPDARPWGFWAARVRQARGGALVDEAARALPDGYRIANPEEARAVHLAAEDVRRRYCASGSTRTDDAMDV